MHCSSRLGSVEYAGQVLKLGLAVFMHWSSRLGSVEYAVQVFYSSWQMFRCTERAGLAVFIALVKSFFSAWQFVCKPSCLLVA